MKMVSCLVYLPKVPGVPRTVRPAGALPEVRCEDSGCHVEPIRALYRNDERFEAPTSKGGRECGSLSAVDGVGV